MVISCLILATSFYLMRSPRTRKEGIKVSGNIEVTSVEVSFRLSGRVAKIMLNEGDTVTADEPVAMLEGDDIEKEVAVKMAEVAVARAALAEVEAGSRSEEIAQAEAAVAAAEAEAERFELDYLRVKNLFEREVLPRQQLETVYSARATSKARLREVRERLRLVVAGPRIDARKQVRSRLDAAEASLALVRNRLKYTTAISPISGVVLSKHVEPGEQVAQGTPIVTVADVATVWMRAYIPETDLGRVKLGQSVRVSTDTWPGKIYNGTVTFISPEAEFTPKNVQTQKERVKLVYRIKITLANDNMELKPGMPADAEIITN